MSVSMQTIDTFVISGREIIHALACWLTFALSCLSRRIVGCLAIENVEYMCWCLFPVSNQYSLTENNRALLVTMYDCKQQ